MSLRPLLLRQASVAVTVATLQMLTTTRCVLHGDDDDELHYLPPPHACKLLTRSRWCPYAQVG